MDGIDPDRLADALRVLAEVEQLPTEHPDAVAVRRATGRLFKTVKEQRRAERRAAILANDRAVTAATATGAPGRIDDETRGLKLTSSATGDRAGTLVRARACYVCKQRYREVDAFYHQLCPPCAARHHERREARTDLTGRRAAAHRRAGEDRDVHRAAPAARRCAHDDHDAVPARRGPAVHRDGRQRRVAAPAARRRDRPARPRAGARARRRRRRAGTARHPHQQRRPDGAPLAGGLRAPGRRRAGAAALGPAAGGHVARPPRRRAREHAGAAGRSLVAHASRTHRARAQRRLASAERVATGRAIDAGGLAPDLDAHNSWSQVVSEVDAVELLEVQLCNQTAPFILVSRLRPALAASPARRTYVVNVSAMEGQFTRGYKGPGHPHTNMAKAALNMLTRTSAKELLSDGILMTSVDTGWITDERPHPTKMRLADDGFHAPLDLVDGAARVYDPIVRGEAGEDLHGVFLKDYRPAPW